jgi:hypothetical protein
MTAANSPPLQSAQGPSSPLDQSNSSSAVSPYSSERVPLPEQTPPPAQLDLSLADLLLASFVILLALLMASTPARNSDLWLHLATGRALADGSYRFQGDPFSHETTSAWIAHSWLYDLATYVLFTRLGGTILVLFKAGLVALLAALLVRLGTRERGLAWPAVAAALAVLAMAGRLLLQPALLSALLLAGTLWLLERGRRQRADSAGGWLSAYGPICLLFTLWANLDHWFLLGPLTVGLYLIGELIGTFAGGSDKHDADLPGLALTFGVGLLACLLTPFHIHGFSVPAELGLTATAKALEQDPVLGHLFVSPFEEMYPHSGAAWSIPGLAYLTLVVLSALSFVGSRQAWRSWRLPVWLGLFGLSASSTRAVPFFAVVAGPILALNVQDLARRYRPAWLRREEFLYARLGRAAAVRLLLGLLVAAWPGWLQGGPYEMRRWVVLADPSLTEAAEKLVEWRKNGRLAEEDHAFNFSPEVANYFAWFCPAAKGIVDARLQAPPEAAADYVTVRRALLDGPTSNGDWRGILRGRRINHVVLYDSNPERVRAVYRRLVQDSQEWFLIGLTGRTALFGWHDPRLETARLEDLRLSLTAEAYQPSEAEKAPAEWPGRGPEVAAWWQPFVSIRPSDSPDRDKAALLLTQFEALRPATLQDRGRAWETTRIAGAIAAGSATLSLGVQQALDLDCFQVLHNELPHDDKGRLTDVAFFALEHRQAYFQDRDDAPPELLWLAIRAARRALRQDPDDASAYVILGRAYLNLGRHTRERGQSQLLPNLARLRIVQTAAAFHQALLVDADLLAAHAGLATLYQSTGQADLQAQHLREVLRLTRAKGCPPGENRADWQQRLDRLQDDVRQADETLHRIENSYEVNAANRKIIDRAEVAQAHGLGGKALELLLSSDAAAFGRRGVQMELDLLLSNGRVREVREWMQPEHKEILGAETYLRDRMLLAAACGDYQGTDAEMAQLADLYDQQLQSLTQNPAFSGLHMQGTRERFPLHQIMAMGLARQILDAHSEHDSWFQVLTVRPTRFLFLNFLRTFAGILQQQAQLRVLRGLFALERGDTSTADDFFAKALELYQSEQAVREGGGLDFRGRRLAEHYWKRRAAPPR